MTDQTNTENTEAVTPVVQFDRDGHKFQVLKNPLPDAGDDDDAFVGYCDGIKSVSSNRADICTRALIRKHIHGLPRGEVVKFGDHVKKQFERFSRLGA